MSIKNLRIELLPARTVMTAGAAGGWGGFAGDGGDGGVSVVVASGNVNFGHDQVVAAYGDASGGDGGGATGGWAGAAEAGRDLYTDRF